MTNKLAEKKEILKVLKQHKAIYGIASFGFFILAAVLPIPIGYSVILNRKNAINNLKEQSGYNEYVKEEVAVLDEQLAEGKLSEDEYESVKAKYQTDDSLNKYFVQNSDSKSVATYNAIIKDTSSMPSYTIPACAALIVATLGTAGAALIAADKEQRTEKEIDQMEKEDARQK
jgi:uncharacterized membrane protein